MTGVELDRLLREAAKTVTRANLMSTAVELGAKGVNGLLAVEFLTGVVVAKENHETSNIPSRATGRRRSTRRHATRT